MLVSCVAYQAGRKLADIGPDEISNHVRRPECFIWVALKEPGPGELAAMQHEFGLHELAVEDARHGHQRPKVEEYGDSLFTVLHMIEVDGAELKVGEVDIFAGPNYILSVRSRTQKGFADVRARCEREPQLTLQENETTKRLAACAALVAVQTMIAGIYGMNFKQMPELNWTYGYPLALFIMAAIDTYLFTRFRKSGWL